MDRIHKAMTYIFIILIAFSVTNVFAQTDTEAPTIDDNTTSTGTSFFGNLGRLFEPTDNEIIEESKPANSPDTNLLVKHRQLKELVEDYKIIRNEQIESLKSTISNIEKTTSELINIIDNSKESAAHSFAEIKKKHEELRRLINKHKSNTKLQIDDLRIEINAVTSSLERTKTELGSKVESTANELGGKIELTKKSTRQSLVELNKTISQNTLYWITSVFIVALLALLFFMLLKKRIFKQNIDLNSNLHNMRKALEEEYVQIDNKLIEIIESQVNIIAGATKGDNKKEDHSLALKVADELVRIRKNITRMDRKTKGLKQLTASLTRIEDNFSSNSYEIVNMLNKPYSEGMKVTANFIPDEDLDEGQQIITRIIKPQVNYQGVMIQSAQIEVSQGE